MTDPDDETFVPADRPAPREQPSSNEVHIRRAPKFGVFIVGGGIVGLVVTFIVTAATEGLNDGRSTLAVTGTTSADPGFWGTVGYFALYGVTAGLVLGALVAVFLDWRFTKRAARLTAERLDISMPEETVEGEIEDDRH